MLKRCPSSPSTSSKPGKRPKQSTTQSTDALPKDGEDGPVADDDLDTLMAQYEQQAQQDMAKVTKKPATPRNAREKLQQGLQTHLDSDNKGFAMLTKMGYTPGTGLGPPTRKGRAEPLGITMRPARSGLGVAEAQQEAQEAQEAQRTQRDAQRVVHEQEARAGFRSSQADAFEQRQHARQLAQAQQTTQALDEQAGILRHAHWPRDEEQQEDAETQQGERDEPVSVQEQLLQVLQYLRQQHCYCLYCGVQYTGLEDMQQQCPGATWAAHQ